MQEDDLVKFFFEMGSLKYVKRSGWCLIGKKDGETVAEHSFRAAIIGYFLAKKEGADADKVLKMCLFHDISESRINDLHKLNQRYIKNSDAELKAFEEQTAQLDEAFRQELGMLFSEFKDKTTKESLIAKDADYLEVAFQAKEYMDQGYSMAKDWIDNVEDIIKTGTAKQLLAKMKVSGSADWWQGLKSISY